MAAPGCSGTGAASDRFPTRPAHAMAANPNERWLLAVEFFRADLREKVGRVNFTISKCMSGHAFQTFLPAKSYPPFAGLDGLQLCAAPLELPHPMKSPCLILML